MQVSSCCEFFMDKLQAPEYRGLYNENADSPLTIIARTDSGIT